MYRPVFSDGLEASKDSSYSLQNDADDDFKRLAAEGVEEASKEPEVAVTGGVWPFLHNQYFQSKGIVLDAQKFMEDDGIEYVLEEMGKQMEQFGGMLSFPDLAVTKQQIQQVSTLKETNEEIRKKQGIKFQELINTYQGEFIKQIFSLNTTSNTKRDLKKFKISSHINIYNKQIETIWYKGAYFFIITGNTPTTEVALIIHKYNLAGN